MTILVVSRSLVLGMVCSECDHFPIATGIAKEVAMGHVQRLNIINLFCAELILQPYLENELGSQVNGALEIQKNP